MSIHEIQLFLEKLESGSVGVDLVKIGLNYAQSVPNTARKYGNNKFRVALDIEQCLDRFYGGYYSDWTCGGQWNRALQFVQLLANAFKSSQIDVIVFFDGTLRENKRMTVERNEFRQRAISVLKHVRCIGTPPPKIWWLPPSGLRTCLRNALRSVNIPVVQTIHDHSMEVIDYYNEHKLNAIIGLHPDFVVSNVSRYFSSHDLRLSYKGALETKEFVTQQVFVALELTQEQLAIVAALLGGYVLIDEAILKLIYQKLKIEANLDFEARIRQLANIVRVLTPGTKVEDIIKQLDLVEFSTVLSETIEYFQRKGVFGGKRYLGNNKKKPITEIFKNIDQSPTEVGPVAPMASETSETDEIANKILNDVNNLVNDNDVSPTEAPKKFVKFIYSLPAEVLRTSYQRHQRGTMDSKIYLLLTKKEILLPQVLEDEQYREMPVHLFYRPARQMIYAILFNLYHQKYMCSKNNDEEMPSPEVIIHEWIWSPNNEYKTPEDVQAVQLQWAIPTIQRLWFGTTFEDKHRRMRGFLTVMRSDSPLMLNRSYVPQHMLVFACVLRYIATSPDRNILTRHELDAFLVTAFSPQLGNVEYTQKMVLPGVYLRGVYLATLFMQGLETAQLANDACGVPLPWLLTNPWLFFDGKLFHLKLKMSVCLQNIRELCDDQLDVVMKIERFRKAILEDVESLVPAHIDALYRPNLFQQTQFSNAFTKNMQPNVQLVHNNYYGGISSNLTHELSPYYNQNQMMSGRSGKIISQKSGRGNYQKSNGYQLKVGGVVVGSWSNGSNRQNVRMMNSRPGMLRYPVGRALSNNRLNRTSAYFAPRNAIRFNNVKTKKNKSKKDSVKPKLVSPKTEDDEIEEKLAKLLVTDDDELLENGDSSGNESKFSKQDPSDGINLEVNVNNSDEKINMVLTENVKESEPTCNVDGKLDVDGQVSNTSTIKTTGKNKKKNKKNSKINLQNSEKTASDEAPQVEISTKA